ncbi:hypothetical protein ACFVXV_43050, partial [Streptomyces sp. NPDC058272]
PRTRAAGEPPSVRAALAKILDTAFSDHDVVVFCGRRASATPSAVLDDLRWVEWRGARHLNGTAGA